jgi:spore coat protein U-like protein
MPVKDIKDIKDSKDAKSRSLPSLKTLLSLVFLFLAAAPAAAQCSLSSTGVSFGTYDVLAPGALSSTGSITWSCPPNRVIEIHLGTGGAGTFLPRRMANGAEHLSYNLYLDAAGTQIWGDGTGGTSIFTIDTGQGGGRTRTITIYGRIPPQQDVTVGVYTDTVVVTLWL